MSPTPIRSMWKCLWAALMSVTVAHYAYQHTSRGESTLIRLATLAVADCSCTAGRDRVWPHSVRVPLNGAGAWLLRWATGSDVASWCARARMPAELAMAAPVHSSYVRRCIYTTPVRQLLGLPVNSATVHAAKEKVSGSPALRYRTCMTQGACCKHTAQCTAHRLKDRKPLPPVPVLGGMQC